ncbi:MAG: hypothetical protein WAM92_21190, partial [Mycobacterium sp.]
AQRAQRPAPPEKPVPHKEREIESWLGELRGTAAGPATPQEGPAERPAPPKPSAEATRAMPEAPPGSTEEAETTAIPKAAPADPDATEKLPQQKPDERRRGGGVSAQDLLRREGRRL